MNEEPQDIFAKEGMALSNAIEQAIDVHGKARMAAIAMELIARVYLRPDDADDADE